MTFLDNLNSLSDSEEAAYIEFLLQYKFNDNCFHYFFEGYEDPSFYTRFITDIIKEKGHYYIGHGKYNLYNIYDTINWSVYDKKRVLLFTDRDYTELIGETLKKDQNIYITDYYSIENHLVCEEVLKRVLREIFHILDESSLNSIIEKFNSEYYKFAKGILYVSAWIVFMRRKKIKVILNEVDLGKLFSISEDLVCKPKGGKRIDYLEHVTSTKTPNNSWSEIRKIISELKHLHPKESIRGKFELWFLVTFLIRLKEQSEKRNYKLKIKTQISHSNCIEIVGPRLNLPNSLQVFLESNAN